MGRSVKHTRSPVGGPIRPAEPDHRPHVLFVHLEPRKSREPLAISKASTSRSAGRAFQSVARVTDFAVSSRTGNVLAALSRLAPRAFPRVVCDRIPLVGRGYASQIDQQVRRNRVDLVVASSSVLLSGWGGRVPAAFWTDAVFGQMLDYYSEFTGLPAWAKRVGESQERRALSRVKVAAYASSWAADAALAVGAQARVLVAPRGPSFSSSEVAQMAGSRQMTRDRPPRLLWVGADWERKGGDIAVAVAGALIRQGREVALDLVGSVPPTVTTEPWITVYGPLRKESPAEREALMKVFAGASVLLAPSRAECLGIAVTEAAAIGLPVVVARTGGLGRMVDGGGFGIVVDQGQGEIGRYAAAVLSILEDATLATQMSAAGMEAARVSYSMDLSAALIVEALLA